MRDSKYFVANGTTDVTSYGPTNTFARKARRLVCKSKTKLVFFVAIIICGFVSKASPLRTKVILVVALLFIVSPFEVVPNATPFVGFTDDIFVRMTVMNTLRKFFTTENSIKARRWFVQRQRRRMLKGILKHGRNNVMVEPRDQ